MVSDCSRTLGEDTGKDPLDHQSCDDQPRHQVRELADQSREPPEFELQRGLRAGSLGEIRGDLAHSGGIPYCAYDHSPPAGGGQSPFQDNFLDCLSEWLALSRECGFVHLEIRCLEEIPICRNHITCFKED